MALSIYEFKALFAKEEKDYSNETHDLVYDWAEVVTEAFCKSEHGAKLSKAASKNVYVISVFAEMAYNYHLVKPGHWIAEDIEDLSSYLQAQLIADNALCFCVFDLSTNTQIGVATYMNNVPLHLKIELGNIWYSPLVQRSKVNLETTYLLLDHAFDLGYRRVEWKCDALNERSRRSALRMGFTFEGIQEAHFIVKGRNRDTAWFRILDREWNDVKKELESLLAS